LIGKYTACLNYGNQAKGHRASGMTTDGGFAEYALHHVSSLYKLPAMLSFKDAVLITTVGTGLYGLEATGGYIAGQDIVIFGPGPVGLMTVQACKQLGAAQVILVGTRENRLEMGRQLGAFSYLEKQSRRSHQNSYCPLVKQPEDTVRNPGRFAFNS
jgi:L-iditol 2-dehydrogenase